MPTTTAKSAYVQGVLDGTPFILVAIPFAVLFGVVATEAGLDLAQTMAFSFVVIAGASQFTAVQLMSDNASLLVVLAASLAVNLRMAMYSASLQPHLGAASLWKRAAVSYLNLDQSYIVSIARYEDNPGMSVNEKVRYFIGAVTIMVPCWYAFTYVGAVAGSAIPDGLALDFAMPILFIAMVGPMLKTLAHLAAALTSIAVALALGFLPSGTSVLFAGLAAMAVGAEVERRMGRP
jgi:predicted branched-subunit amino acid permease